MAKKYSGVFGIGCECSPNLLILLPKLHSNIEKFSFADKMLSSTEVRHWPMVQYGGDANDRLEGGLGDDTYVFVKDDGQDRIYDSGGNDTLRLLDLTVDDLWFSRTGFDLEISVIGSDDQVTTKINFCGFWVIRIGLIKSVWAVVAYLGVHS